MVRLSISWRGNRETVYQWHGYIWTGLSTGVRINHQTLFLEQGK